jgi:hypothetical protein
MDKVRNPSNSLCEIHSVTFFFSTNSLADEDKSHAHFMADNATAHAANNSMYAIDEGFGEQVTRRGLWSMQLSSLSHCNFCRIR